MVRCLRELCDAWTLLTSALKLAASGMEKPCLKLVCLQFKKSAQLLRQACTQAGPREPTELYRFPYQICLVCNLPLAEASGRCGSTTMATLPSNAKTPIRPYRRFLNSALHTRLQHASLLALLLSWDNAFWVGSQTSCKSQSNLLRVKC
jgi:hypothetical protein